MSGASSPIASTAYSLRTQWIDPFAPVVVFTISCLFEFVFPLIYAQFGGEFQSARAKTLGLRLEDLYSAFQAFLVFWVCWMVGYAMWIRVTWTRTQFFQFYYPRVSGGLLTSIHVVLWLIFLLMFFLHPNYGGPRAALAHGTYGKIFFLYLSLFAAVTGAMLVWRFREFSRDRKWGQLMICLLIMGGVFFTFSLLEGRGRAFSVILLGLCCFHYGVRRIPLAVFLGIMMSAIFGAIMISYWEIRGSGAELSFLDLAFGLDKRRNFDGIYNAALLIQHVEMGRVTFDYGVSILNETLMDVGVQIFSNSGTRDFFMSEVLFMEDYTAGVALSKVGEFYRAGGLAGVAVGGLLLGSASQVYYHLLVKERLIGDFSYALYFLTLGSLGVASVRGYFGGKLILAGVKVVLFMLVVLLLFKSYSVLRNVVRERVSQPEAEDE